jgi:hypothetical protein
VVVGDVGHPGQAENSADGRDGGGDGAEGETTPNEAGNQQACDMRSGSQWMAACVTTDLQPKPPVSATGSPGRRREGEAGEGGDQPRLRAADACNRKEDSAASLKQRKRRESSGMRAQAKKESKN